MRTGLLAGLLSAILLTNGVIAQTPVTGNEPIRLLSWNIKHAAGNDDCVNPTPVPGTPPATECAVDLERIASLIERENPDIVTLQEVDRFWARSGQVDQAEELASMLGMTACFGPNLSHEADEHADVQHQYGTAILTRFEIRSCENTFLPTDIDWEQRGLLGATISTPSRDVTVFTAHLQAGREGFEDVAQRQRDEQATMAAEIVAATEGPVVMTGDLNATPTDPELDAFLGASSPVTNGCNPRSFTSPASPERPATATIDYILAGGGAAVSDCRTLVDELSMIAADHYPMVATITIDVAGAGTPAA